VTMWERRAELEGFAAVMEAIRNARQVSRDARSRVLMTTNRSRHWPSAANSGSRTSFRSQCPPTRGTVRGR